MTTNSLLDAIPLGKQVRTPLTLSESYTGNHIQTPICIKRGKKDGPVLTVSAALHGDEINGTGAIRQIIQDVSFTPDVGTLILIPVINIQGFERCSRYLPDRRDLNRLFPGDPDGSPGSRIADAFFSQVIQNSNYCIDLHTAAVRRTNFPNIRGNLKDARVADLARAFGAGLIVNNQGPPGTLRRSACESGCPTIILEAGEVLKVEPGVVELTIRGIKNCMIHLGMISGTPTHSPFQVETDGTRWIRAEDGGFLDFHVSPGDIVAKGDHIATVTNLYGDPTLPLEAPRDGVILGMTTLPAVSPGDPVCHLAFTRRKALKAMERIVDKLDDTSLHERLKDELSSSITVSEPS